MQLRPPPPRWHSSVPQTPWVRPPARPPVFVPPLPPPRRGFPGPPRFFPLPPCPPRGFSPRFVPPPPPCPPVVDAEQLWLDTFKRTHCRSEDSAGVIADDQGEPPLRLLRRRVAKAQKLAEQLKVAATELAAIEKRLGTLQPSSGGDAAQSVEAPRLRVQRERKLAVCEALKKDLEAMNATSGLFPKQQLTEIRAFTARVNRKKAYRKRVKLRRRAEASVRRAVDSKTLEEAEPTGEDKVELKTREDEEQCEEKTTPPTQHPRTIAREQQTATYLSTKERSPPKRSLDPLDPETLTIDTLIAARRAWDSHIVFPQTRGASTIPPHFVPPPAAPPIQWAVYVVSSARASAG